MRLRALFACSLALAACAEDPAPQKGAADVDIVLYVVDALRRDALGTYGNANAATSTLDSLAAESVVFERATTVAPRTGPARAEQHESTLPRPA